MLLVFFIVPNYGILIINLVVFSGDGSLQTKPRVRTTRQRFPAELPSLVLRAKTGADLGVRAGDSAGVQQSKVSGVRFRDFAHEIFEDAG